MTNSTPPPVDLESLDLNLLTVLELLVRTGSAGATADRLGRTTPWVSQALTRLRTQLGDPLFFHDGRRMIPTERALQLAPGVGRALAELRQIIATEPRFEPASSLRVFRIDIPVGGDLVLAPTLTAFAAERAPGVGFVITSSRAGEVWPELQAGEIDLAIDYVELDDDEDLRHKLLYDDPFVVMTRRNHPAVAAAGGLTREVFAKARHVAVSWARNPRESPVDRRLADVGIKRRSSVFVPSIAAIPGVVEATDYFAMLSRRTARTLARHWQIDIHECPFEFQPIPIYIVWHRRFDADPGHAWLRNAMVDVCEAL